MPFYDYKCIQCQTIIELREGPSDNAKLHTCPVCEGEMNRMISALAGFTIKKYPPGHNLSLKQRKKLWHSDDIDDFRRIN